MWKNVATTPFLPSHRNVLLVVVVVICVESTTVFRGGGKFCNAREGIKYNVGLTQCLNCTQSQLKIRHASVMQLII